jgi:hypothetical protein
MNQKPTGSRIKRELSRLMASHRVTSSDSGHFVKVRPESYPEVASIVTYAQENGVMTFPVPEDQQFPSDVDWHIRLDLSGLNSVISHLKDSRVVGVQAGIQLESLVDWVYDKHLELRVMPEFLSELELWEFLLSPQSGRYGPGMGDKWDQVMNIKAVLPNGRLFQTSLSPARAAGPDFTSLILTGRGRFGIPLETHLRLAPRPPKREYMAFSLKSLFDGLAPAAEIVGKVAPEFIEVGLNRNLENKGLPSHFLLVELWGEGAGLSLRKEAVRMALEGIGTPVSIPYEVLLGFDETYGFRSRACHQMYLRQTDVRDVVSKMLKGPKSMISKVRLLGFLDHYVCVTHDGEAGFPGGPCNGTGGHRTTESARPIWEAMANQLDPAGIFSHIPSLWEATS